MPPGGVLAVYIRTPLPQYPPGTRQKATICIFLACGGLKHLIALR